MRSEGQYRRFWAGVPIWALAIVGAAWPTAAEVDFEDQIFPILQRSCLGCHGPEQQLRGLRLDARESVVGSSAPGSLLVPGSAQYSELYRRIAGLSDGPRMPMGGTLSDVEIDTIRLWIEAGAEWPKGTGAAAEAVGRHWAFVAPERPLPPGDQSLHPIDAFVRARLADAGLEPMPRASDAALLRRVSLDLTGLPPTVEELEEFLEEPDYGALVGRLLASPHYGERWGRVWLDAARYADSDGYEKDMPRQVWFYRDWVVDALNRDLPYDRFVVEQIAGDLLPGRTQQQLVATGYLRNSMVNEEGGTDPEQFRMEALFDRMDAIGKGILGLTIQCAQCHSHKYDPLTHEEYYRLFAFLNNADEAKVAVFTAADAQVRQAVIDEIRAIEDELMASNPDWQARMASWEQQVRGDQPRWTVLHPDVDDLSTGGQRYLLQSDGSLLAQGYAPTEHVAEFSAHANLTEITAVRLEVLTDPNLPLGGPGRSVYGTGALSEFRLRAAPADDPSAQSEIWIRTASADIDLPERSLDPKAFPHKEGLQRLTGPIHFAYDDCVDTAWDLFAGHGRSNQPRKAVFVVDKPIKHGAGAVLTFFLDQSHGGYDSNVGQNNNLGRIRFSVTDAADPVADPLPARVREIVERSRDGRTPEEDREVFSYWRTTIPAWIEANDRIEQAWRRVPQGNTQLVLNERSKPRRTHLLRRGDFLEPANEVEPGVPEFLHALGASGQPPRLAFAEWLVDRRAPTTARAIVNRIWQSYFGTGLVATAEDFGMQGDLPSHPALLDWLAVELMDSGWSLKHLHRLIVTSDTYRQVSRLTVRARAVDPENRLLSGGPRMRADAEIVRDIALAVSGLLSRQVGGPPVHPPAPELLFKPPISFSDKPWPASAGQDRYRRALYTFQYISAPYPAFEVFDAPNGSTACVRRGRSNTPLQALTTLNEELFMEAARALARHTVAAAAGERDRIDHAFRSCLSRSAQPGEAELLLELLRKTNEQLAAGLLDPWELTAADPGEGSRPDDEAAWTVLARALLNLDETITKQ